MLQVSIFHTLQKNLSSIDFSILLTEVMTIADEIDSQLSQAMASYVGEPADEALPPPSEEILLLREIRDSLKTR